MSVKPLTAQTLTALLARVENAREGVIRSIIPLSPTSIEIRFSVQDIARGYDWIDVALRIDGVRDAKLTSDNVLASLDMNEGITAEIGANSCGLAIGRYAGRVNEAPLYIIGTSMGYEELPFSG